jgi:hypothetical protein
MRAITLGVGSSSWAEYSHDKEIYKAQLSLAMQRAREQHSRYPSRLTVICDNGMTCFHPAKTSAYLERIKAKYYT